MKSNKFINYKSHEFFIWFVSNLFSQLNHDKNENYLFCLANSFINIKKCIQIAKKENDELDEFEQFNYWYFENKNKNPFANLKNKVLFGVFPFDFELNSEQNLKLNERLFSSLELIQDDGLGLYFLPNFDFLENKEILRKLNKKDFYINAIFNMPKSFMFPIFSSRCILIIISRQKKDKLFVAEFPNWLYLGKLEIVFKQFFNKKLNNSDKAIFSVKENVKYDLDGDSNPLLDGVFLNPKEFKGFVNWHIKNKISNLRSDYIKYETMYLSQLSNSIKFLNPDKKEFSFKNIKNAIYIPLFYSKKFNLSAEKQTESLKTHRWYCQVIVNTNLIEFEYLYKFLNSYLGKLILKLKSFENQFSSHLSNETIKNIEIAVPSKNIQKEIVTSIAKLDTISREIDALSKNISINPISSENEKNQISMISDIIGQLSDKDKVRIIIQNGENKHNEFKSSAFLDLKTNQKVDYLITPIIKTIAAYMNTDGGNLIVGVNDSSDIIGIANELKLFPSRDRYLQTIENHVKAQLGTQNTSQINYKFVEIKSNVILLISVLSKSKKEVYIKEKEFYIRSTPSTRKLEGREMNEYIETNFRK